MSITRRALLATAPTRWIAAQTALTRVLFGGDVMLARYVGKTARLRRDPAWPFRHIAEFLQAADIAFVNLESPFTDRGRPSESGMIFRAAPEMVEGLRLAGIDVVSTANNHARDCGSYGLEFTLRWLARNGLYAVGTGLTPEAAREGAVVVRNGVRFGFLAYTYDQSNGNYPASDPRVNVMDTRTMREDVTRLGARADVVIVSMHAGDEYRRNPNRQQVDFAHAALEAGASVVAGHHPHVIQPAERHRGGVIFYSLGNLVFDQFHRRDTQEGLLGEVVFWGTAIHDVKLHRVVLAAGAPHLASRQLGPMPVSTTRGTSSR
jgi:poly-gamma-glutamate capsule biosynthesis protein CapA/YwtB (metallophosphatase superfamily)